MVGLLHTAVRLWIVLGPGMSGPGRSDEQSFHLPVIQSFASQWPNLDLSDYLAASTPGYHIAMVGVSALTRGDLDAMRLTSGALVTLLILALVWFAGRRVGGVSAFALSLPLIASPYVLGASTLLLPEGAAWTLLTCLILLMLRPRVDWKTYALAGTLVLLIVFTRQIFLWGAGLVWLGAWLGPDAADGPPSRLIPPRGRWLLAQRIPRAVLAFAITLPAFACVWSFYRLWGGLTPPLFQEGGDAAMELAGTHTGANPSVVLLTLALLALAGVFYVGYLIRPLQAAWVQRRALCARALTLGGALGLTLALAIPSSFDREAGRYSGLWNAIGRLPTLADRSPVMLALAPAGGVMLAAIWLVLPRRAGWIIIASVAGFAIAQSANHQAWQRYVEPMALIVLMLTAALASRPSAGERPVTTPRWAWLGPAALAVLLGLVSLTRIGA